MSRASDSNFFEDDGANSVTTTGKRPKYEDTKKQRDRSGTRCVRVLTPEQLRKKRAIDREAQRKIRAKTREHIERLERRIKDLSEGQPQLAEALQKNDALEEEVTRLKKSINASASTAPVYGPSYLAPAPTFNYTSSSSPSNLTWTSQLHRCSNCGTPVSQGSSYGSSCVEFGQLEVSNLTTSVLPATESLVDTGIDSLSLFQLGRNTPFQSRDPDSCSSVCLSPEEQWEFDRLMAGVGCPTLGNMQTVANSMEFQLPHSLPTNSTRELQPPPPFSNSLPQPAWSIPIRLVPPTCPFDSILTNLIQQQKILAVNSLSNPTAGPPQPSMNFILFSNSNHTSHPISMTLSNLLHKYFFQDLPVKAAVLYLLYRFTQYQISPSAITYDALPDWETPGITQLEAPHPAWVDMILWGKLRDKVIGHQELYANEQFLTSYWRNLNVNWPFGVMDAFYREGDEVLITENFETHVRTLANWSLDEEFAKEYPEVREDCRFTVSGYEMAP